MGLQCRFPSPIWMLVRFQALQGICHSHSLGVGLGTINPLRQVMPYAGLQFMTFDQSLIGGLVEFCPYSHGENHLSFR